MWILSNITLNIFVNFKKVHLTVLITFSLYNKYTLHEVSKVSHFKKGLYQF